MFQINEPDLMWAVSKAALIIFSGLVSIIGLAWVGHKRMFPK